MGSRSASSSADSTILSPKSCSKARLDGFKSHGGERDQLTVVRVPGAFEIAIVADKMAASGQYDALVCLGAVIRGDTPHFDYVCDAVTRGLGEAVQNHKIPIGFGVLDD